MLTAVLVRAGTVAAGLYLLSAAARVARRLLAPDPDGAPAPTRAPIDVPPQPTAPTALAHPPSWHRRAGRCAKGACVLVPYILVCALHDALLHPRQVLRTALCVPAAAQHAARLCVTAGGPVARRAGARSQAAVYRAARTLLQLTVPARAAVRAAVSRVAAARVALAPANAVVRRCIAGLARACQWLWWLSCAAARAVRGAVGSLLRAARALHTAVGRPARRAARALWAAVVTVGRRLRGAALALWHTVRSVQRATFALLTAVWQPVRVAVRALWSTVVDAGRRLWGAVRAVVDAAWRPVHSVALAAGRVSGRVARAAHACLTACGRAALTLWGHVWAAVVDAGRQLWGAVRAVAAAAWRPVHSAVRAAGWVSGRVARATHACLAACGRAALTLWDHVWAAVVDAGRRLWGAVRAVVAAVGRPVLSAVRAAGWGSWRVARATSAWLAACGAGMQRAVHAVMVAAWLPLRRTALACVQACLPTALRLGVLIRPRASALLHLSMLRARQLHRAVQAAWDASALSRVAPQLRLWVVLFCRSVCRLARALGAAARAAAAAARAAVDAALVDAQRVVPASVWLPGPAPGPTTAPADPAWLPEHGAANLPPSHPALAGAEAAAGEGQWRPEDGAAYVPPPAAHAAGDGHWPSFMAGALDRDPVMPAGWSPWADQAEGPPATAQARPCEPQHLRQRRPNAGGRRRGLGRDGERAADHGAAAGAAS
jgi:hypothetical protein